MAGDAPVCLPTLIWLLIINNFTDTNKVRSQDRGSVNLSQEFPGKAGVALEEYPFFAVTPQNVQTVALQVSRYTCFSLGDWLTIRKLRVGGVQAG